MNDIGLAVAGKDITPDKFDVINPSTAKAFAECPSVGREQLNAAVDKAHEAFRSWSADLDARRNALAKCAEVLRAAKDEIGEILTREQGKPLGQARGEAAGAANQFDYFSALPFEKQILKDDDSHRIELHRKPYGVVGAIAPWNYPLILASWKVAPALLAGNTVILKPSPFTPLSSLKMGEVLQKILPPGVLTVLSGGADLGKWICEHPLIRKISFTGSVATGKRVMETAASDLKRVTLELGGNDPAIVLGDVDPKVVADRLFGSAFANSGQLCVAIKRLYVHESIFPNVVSEITDIAKAANFGDGFEDGVEYGPINNLPQYRRVKELVEDARNHGATIHTCGTSMERGGYFFAPTIVTEVMEGTRLVDEEQFGPALPIMPFDDLDEVIERANNTHFGLGGSIWTNDLSLGADLAGRLESGTGWVNQHSALSDDAPFGGSKWSGVGYEAGSWGLDSMCQLQVINVRKK